MAENSAISWTTHTFNPWRGCQRVSPGCVHCYAETMSLRNQKVFGEWGSQGTRVIASEAQWREPLKWNRKAKEAGERHRVFCGTDVLTATVPVASPIQSSHIFADKARTLAAAGPSI